MRLSEHKIFLDSRAVGVGASTAMHSLTNVDTMSHARDNRRIKISRSSASVSLTLSSRLVLSAIALCLSHSSNQYLTQTDAFVVVPQVSPFRLTRYDSSLFSSVNSNNNNNNNNNMNAPRRPPNSSTGTRTTSSPSFNRPPYSSSSSSASRAAIMRNKINKLAADANRPPLNDEIKFPSLRVTISGKVTDANKVPKDEPLGIMTKAEALLKAKEMGNLDLILINEHSDPPVAKIADYSKYRYEKEKKAKEVKKNSKSTELKEIKMSYSIDTHDYDVRVKAASKFIMQGNRVKCSILFKGREIQHDALGYELLNQMAEDLKKICLMEGKPKREGKTLSSILCPKAEVTKAVNDKKRAEEKARKKKKAEDKRLAAATGGVVEDDDDDEDDDDEDDDENDTLNLNLEEDDDDEDDISLEDLLKTDKLTGDLFA